MKKFLNVCKEFVLFSFFGLLGGLIAAVIVTTRELVCPTGNSSPGEVFILLLLAAFLFAPVVGGFRLFWLRIRMAFNE